MFNIFIVDPEHSGCDFSEAFTGHYLPDNANTD